MSIVDELVEVLETGVGEWVRPGPEVAQAVLDHLAAKAGDVRGMLPQPRDIGREALRTDNIDGETMAEWYTRAGNAVLDLCVECLAPFVGAMRVQREPDGPIDDPEERAKAVAEELRSRGFDAQVDGGCAPAVLVPMFRNWGMRCLVWERFDMNLPMFKIVGPKGIADHLQQAKARGAMCRGNEAKGLEDAVVDSSDMPISDPSERAKAVARILRGRGLHALPVHWDILLPCVAGDSCGGWRGRSVRDAELSTIAPRAIADEIQREEARRAQAWAGDTEGA